MKSRKDTIYPEVKDMGNKLKAYIKQLRSFLENTAELSDPEGFKKELLREIQFWQHERFIHLIVTFMFAIVTVAVLLVMIFKPMIPLFLLFVLLLCLLFPYITHYFVLENGVQTLYVIYEEVCRRYMDGSIPKRLYTRRIRNKNRKTEMIKAIPKTVLNLLRDR